MLFSSLDLVYIVLAAVLLPIGILLSMILWRFYCMLDRIERILSFVDRMAGYGQELEKIPMMIIEKFIRK